MNIQDALHFLLLQIEPQVSQISISFPQQGSVRFISIEFVPRDDTPLSVHLPDGFAVMLKKMPPVVPF